MRPKENVKESSFINAEPKEQVADNTSDKEYV